MRTHVFDSKFTIRTDMAGNVQTLDDFDQETVKNEPMMWSCQPSFAYDHGGPITRQFLEKVFNIGPITSYYAKELYKYCDDRYCFDSRVHMLMPGWFPCIPGWHHDDVPRSRSDGQPNYENPEFKSQHILALVNGDIAPTEFAVGRAIMPVIPLYAKHPIYKYWHDQVELDIRDNCLERVPVPSNRLIGFDYQAFHQGVRAVKAGWRWFGRISWNAGYESGRPHHNEIRKQVQVYLEHPMEGW
jgi:hypothetical protein